MPGAEGAHVFSVLAFKAVASERGLSTVGAEGPGSPAGGSRITRQRGSGGDRRDFSGFSVASTLTLAAAVRVLAATRRSARVVRDACRHGPSETQDLVAAVVHAARYFGLGGGRFVDARDTGCDFLCGRARFGHAARQAVYRMVCLAGVVARVLGVLLADSACVRTARVLVAERRLPAAESGLPDANERGHQSAATRSRRLRTTGWSGARLLARSAASRARSGSPSSSDASPTTRCR